MTVVAQALSAVLALIAAIHVLWGIGLWVPIRDEAPLARTVVGAAGIERMPGAVPCALVAVALMAGITWIWLPPDGLRQLGLAAGAAIFSVRGVLAYLPVWRRLTPVQPFATLDRRLYGPLCLLLGAGFLALFIEGA
jgi:hypothetical protein